MLQAFWVVLGALVGGTVGYFGFFWVASQGLYAPVLPGGMLGIVAGRFRNRSLLLAVVCGLAALALGVVAEWRLAPFKNDGSFTFFLANLHRLKPVTLILLALGAAIGFWGPYARWREWKSEYSHGA
jgi:hypothetical protein